MPVYLNITNFIFDKKAVEKRVKGGHEAFRNEYFLRHSELSQEDDALFLVAGNSYYIRLRSKVQWKVQRSNVKNVNLS